MGDDISVAILTVPAYLYAQQITDRCRCIAELNGFFKSTAARLSDTWMNRQLTSSLILL